MSDLHLRSHLIRLAQSNLEMRPRILQALTESAMSESDFWKIVDEVGWGTKTTDYHAVKGVLLRNLSPNQAASFATMESILHNKLDKALVKFEADGDKDKSQRGNPNSIGLGDDSYGDLIAHIIGLGEKEYEAVLKKPALAQERVRKGDFKESFEYCIPRASDYRLLDKEHYQQQGVEILRITEWLLSRPDTKPLNVALKTLQDGFELLNHYQVQDFAAQEMALLGASRVVRDWWISQKSLSDNDLPGEVSPRHLFSIVQNILHDVKNYLL